MFCQDLRVVRGEKKWGKNLKIDKVLVVISFLVLFVFVFLKKKKEKNIVFEGLWSQKTWVQIQNISYVKVGKLLTLLESAPFKMEIIPTWQDYFQDEC